MSVHTAATSRGFARRFATTFALGFGLLLAAFSAQAGNLWLTGHDADFHCDGTGGSQCNYFGIAANFIRQSAPTKTLPILVLDSGTQVANSLNSTEAKSKNTVEGPGAAYPFTVVDPTSPAFATTPINVASFSAMLGAVDGHGSDHGERFGLSLIDIGGGRYHYTRNQRGQRSSVAAIERKIVDSLFVDHLG